MAEHPHSDNPVRRVVLGPIPADAASNQMLLFELERKGLTRDPNFADIPTTTSSAPVSPALSALRRQRQVESQRSFRAKRRTPLRPRISRAKSTSMMSLRSIASSKTLWNKFSKSMEDSPQSMHQSVKPQSTPQRDLDESPQLSRARASPPPRIDTSTPLLFSGKRELSVAPSSMFDDVDSVFSSGTYRRGWMRRRRGHHWPTHLFSPHPTATPLLWDDPWAPPASYDASQLSEDERKDLIARLSISFLYQHMIGDSFEIGETFFAHVLEEESDDLEETASAPSFINVSPTVRHSSRSSCTQSGQNGASDAPSFGLGLDSEPLPAQISPVPRYTLNYGALGSGTNEKRMPRLPSAMSKRRVLSDARPKPANTHVTFALPEHTNADPSAQDLSIEDRTGWDETKNTLDKEGSVWIESGKPSKTMLALENELHTKRAELTNMVANGSQHFPTRDSSSVMYTPPSTPPLTAHATELLTSQEAKLTSFDETSLMQADGGPAVQVGSPPVPLNGSTTPSPKQELEFVAPTNSITSPHSEERRRRHWPHPEIPQWVLDKRRHLHWHKRHEKVPPKVPSPLPRTSFSNASLESLAAEPTTDTRVKQVSDRITSQTVSQTPTPSRRLETSAQLQKTPAEAHDDFRGLTPHKPHRLEPGVNEDKIDVGAGDLSPPPPEEVLSRRTVAPVPEPASSHGQDSPAAPIFKRDRMLVKVQIATNDVAGTNFDEFEARRYDLRSYRWAEYVVLVRPGRLELWSQASVRARVLGDTERLKRRYTISLKPGESTLSLYSETDRLLCLTSPRSISTKGQHGHRFPFKRHGSLILLLNARTASMAADWMWMLWRELGGTLPPHLFVYIPAISMRVRVPIPPLPDTQGLSREYDVVMDVPQHADLEEYEAYMSRALLREVVKLVRAVPQWASLSEAVSRRGLTPSLVWRSGMIYNWVLYDTTPEGMPRYWNVLAGSLLSTRRRAPVLELVMNSHYPTQVLHPNGHALSEPRGVEGYVGRLRSVSNTTSRVYLSVHDGCVFLLRESFACVPDRFAGVPLGPVNGATRKERVEARIHQFTKYERAREWHQIRFSEGFIDLRDVCAIGHVGAGVILSTELYRQGATDGLGLNSSSALENVQKVEEYDGTRTAIDKRLFALDQCTELETETAHSERMARRAMRQFQLYLENGRNIVFECASFELAKEWIVHLFMLTVYWRCRRKTDIRIMMKASDNLRAQRYGPSYVDDMSLRSLPYLWNWCCIDDCRAVSLSGHLFWRTNVRHPFRRRVFILSNGQLHGFKLMSSTRSSTSRQNEGIVYRRKGAPISLRDAYIYTGQLSDRSSDLHDNESAITRTGAQDPHEMHEQLPRLYRDGLTSSESHEECSFVLRVRRVPDIVPPKHLSGHKTPLPKPRDHTEITFRARTVLERDLWVRHITVEMEKIVRANPDREKHAHHFGRVY